MHSKTLLTAISVGLIAFSSVAEEKPNIVLIFLDNFGWGEPGFNGGGIVRGAETPRLDQIADEGLSLKKFQCRSAVPPLRARRACRFA